MLAASVSECVHVTVKGIRRSSDTSRLPFRFGSTSSVKLIDPCVTYMNAYVGNYHKGLPCDPSQGIFTEAGFLDLQNCCFVTFFSLQINPIWELHWQNSGARTMGCACCFESSSAAKVGMGNGVPTTLCFSMHRSET